MLRPAADRPDRPAPPTSSVVRVVYGGRLCRNGPHAQRSTVLIRSAAAPAAAHFYEQSMSIAAMFV
eukprot:1644-Heterococcus_DN1.PRE.1